MKIESSVTIFTSTQRRNLLHLVQTDTVKASLWTQCFNNQTSH